MTSETDNIRDSGILVLTADQDQPAVGQGLVYTVVYQNTGDELYLRAKIYFALPTALNFLASNPEPDSVVGNVFTFVLETLEPGEGDMISIDAEGNNALDSQKSIVATTVLEYEDEFGDVHTVSAFHTDEPSRALAGDIDRRNLFAFVSVSSTGLWILVAVIILFAIYILYRYRMGRLIRARAVSQENQANVPPRPIVQSSPPPGISLPGYPVK